MNEDWPVQPYRPGDIEGPEVAPDRTVEINMDWQEIKYNKYKQPSEEAIHRATEINKVARDKLMAFIEKQRQHFDDLPPKLRDAVEHQLDKYNNGEPMDEKFFPLWKSVEKEND